MEITLRQYLYITWHVLLLCLVHHLYTCFLFSFLRVRSENQSGKTSFYLIYNKTFDWLIAIKSGGSLIFIGHFLFLPYICKITNQRLSNYFLLLLSCILLWLLFDMTLFLATKTLCCVSLFSLYIDKKIWISQHLVFSLVLNNVLSLIVVFFGVYYFCFILCYHKSSSDIIDHYSVNDIATLLREKHTNKTTGNITLCAWCLKLSFLRCFCTNY